MAEPEVLALWSQYGDLYNEIVRPERKYTISHYLRTQWAPLLGAARLWFVVALRQRCFWNHKQDWCVVDKKTLARESGLSLRTVNRIVAAVDHDETEDCRDSWAGWFFGKTRRRRYHQGVGRTVNAPNRYHVLLDDPLTPAHQAALVSYLRAQTAEGTPEDTLLVLQELCQRADLLYEILSSPHPGPAPAASKEAISVLDLVRAVCPLPPQESALYPDIAQAASRLHNAITRPERVYVGNQYFRLRWLPELGPVLSSLVVNLRARCYWNQRTGELRDTCQATWAELAQETGCTARQLRNLRQKPDLPQFVETLSEGHGRARSTFRVRLYDPLTTPDRDRFDKLAQATPGVQLDPETGQLDMYPLLTRASMPKTGSSTRSRGLDKAKAVPPDQPPKAEKKAPGSLEQAEVLAQSEQAAASQADETAHSEQKFWHLEGIQAEVLARQTGNSGTTSKIQIITPTLVGLTETTLSPGTDDPKAASMLAAVRTHLLTQLGIQEPNRSHLLLQQPRCDWIVAWGLYVLTQPGLSKNKAGYVYNRLWHADSPPSDLLELAGLPPPSLRLFCQAEKRGDEMLVPDALRASFQVWRRLLAPLCDRVLSAPDVRNKPEIEQPSARTQAEEAVLPESVTGLLLGHEEIGVTSAGWEIVCRDLAHAARLARVIRAGGLEQQIVVLFISSGQQYALNAEVLALGVEPLSRETWDTVRQELQWQMTRDVFDRWWRDVQPLGIKVEPGANPYVVLGAPSAAVRAWIVSKHMPSVERTLGGVLGQAVAVRVMVYAQPLPEVSIVQGG